MYVIFPEGIGRDDVIVDGEVYIPFKYLHKLRQCIDSITERLDVSFKFQDKLIRDIAECEIIAESSQNVERVLVVANSSLRQFAFMYLLLHPLRERAVILHGQVFWVVRKQVDIPDALGVILVPDLDLDKCISTC